MCWRFRNLDHWCKHLHNIRHIIHSVVVYRPTLVQCNCTTPTLSLVCWNNGVTNIKFTNEYLFFLHSFLDSQWTIPVFWLYSTLTNARCMKRLGAIWKKSFWTRDYCQCATDGFTWVNGSHTGPEREVPRTRDVLERIQTRSLQSDLTWSQICRGGKLWNWIWFEMVDD